MIIVTTFDMNVIKHIKKPGFYLEKMETLMLSNKINNIHYFIQSG